MDVCLLIPGSRVGSYEILASLGAGGIGAVYRVRDTKLNRDVALKVLLPEVANDPDRLARFRRESQVLASLSHANIGAIYTLDEADGVIALVLELVEGPTLADRIARGAIPLDEALPIARQIAEALTLFATRIVDGGEERQQATHYDVAPDGRFLINRELGDAEAPITLLMNWRPRTP